MGFVGINENITVPVFGAWFGHANLLMPAMLAADKVGLHGKGQILMHSGILPENSLGVRIIAFERLDPVHMAHHPFPIADPLKIDKRGGPTLAPLIFSQTPPTEVVRARNDTRLDSFRHPDLIDEIADLRMHLQQIVCLHFEPFGIERIDPERIAIGNLVQPLGISRSRVD